MKYYYDDEYMRGLKKYLRQIERGLCIQSLGTGHERKMHLPTSAIPLTEQTATYCRLPGMPTLLETTRIKERQALWVRALLR